MKAPTPSTPGQIQPNPNQELQSLFISYWEMMAVRAACQLDLFDLVAEGAKTPTALAHRTGVPEERLCHLLEVLLQKDYLTQGSEGGLFRLSAKGWLLTDKEEGSMKAACIMWGGEHVQAWQGLSYSLRNGIPWFKNYYGKPFFNFLEEHPEKLKEYHQAISYYARSDYQILLSGEVDWDNKTVLDVGGGTGTILSLILDHFPQAQCHLFDLPNVIEAVIDPRIHCHKGDFFKSINVGIEPDVVILGRILHDWPDPEAKTILSNVRQILPKDGRLYILENMADELVDGGHLLSLNLLAVCGSQERTKQQYRELLVSCGFALEEPNNKNLKVNTQLLVARPQ